VVRTTEDPGWLQPPSGGFRDNLRAIFRRRPNTVERSIGIAELLDECLLFVGIGVVIGAFIVAVTSEFGPLPPVWLLVVMAQPFGWAHIAGVRHRWLALAAATAVGSTAGYAVVAVLPGADWADLVGVSVGTLAAVAPYALATQVGTPDQRR
jgi:hypothetical protein